MCWYFSIFHFFVRLSIHLYYMSGCKHSTFLKFEAPNIPVPLRSWCFLECFSTLSISNGCYVLVLSRMSQCCPQIVCVCVCVGGGGGGKLSNFSGAQCLHREAIYVPLIHFVTFLILQWQVKHGIKVSTISEPAYELYFDMKIGDQYKSWDPQVVCGTYRSNVLCHTPNTERTTETCEWLLLLCGGYFKPQEK